CCWLVGAAGMVHFVRKYAHGGTFCVLGGFLNCNPLGCHLTAGFFPGLLLRGTRRKRAIRPPAVAQPPLGHRCSERRTTGGSCVTGLHQMAPEFSMSGSRYRAYTSKHLDELTARAGLDGSERLAVKAVATVLPFRTNEYVVERLIDWNAAP